MLAAAADRVGERNPPAAPQAAVWLHTEVLPKGLMDSEQANTLMRALALAQAPELPDVMLDALIADAEKIVGATE